MTPQRLPTAPNPGIAKTDPKRAQERLHVADQRRALEALVVALAAADDCWRWRQILEWLPRDSRIAKRAQNELMSANVRRHDHLLIVRRALGEDPDADEPGPKTHWDKGA